LRGALAFRFPRVMRVPFNFAAGLEAELRNAARVAGLDDASAFIPEVRVADPRHGDYQANGVLGYAKAHRLNPRTTAATLVAALPETVRQESKIAIAGPGFINFTLRSSTLDAWLRAHDTADCLRAGAASVGKGQTWVIDYSSPNTAKQMHVGHLRSAVIGEAISRLLEFCGARVIRDNHIGDWGTQFGMLIWAYKRHLDREALNRDPLEEFERLYKVGNESSGADPAVLEAARAELVRLQAGDAENRAIWESINTVSLAAFQKIYDHLGIQFDVTLGESFYNDKVDRIYRELTEAELAVGSEGALVVFHPEHPRFKEQPLIVRKRDGAANYASTDLAAILHRVEHFQATGALYVVDKRQSDHFEQLFLTVRKWFAHAGRVCPQLEHVDFGTVLGENGRPLKTRTGENIRLRELLAEAGERAYTLVTKKSPDLPEAERRAIAAVVGIGSVQYADLSQNRSSDYVFSWDKMISLDGNTAAYLLYAVARILSIFRRLEISASDSGRFEGATPLETPAELALARKLVKFPNALDAAVGQLRPHFLCLYLYELTGEFSGFYNSDKVGVEDRAIRARRLTLCARTRLILETGLQLIGLRTLTRM
jgi:arginyl-tRNA synthetase